jgi:hypothetical protein
MGVGSASGILVGPLEDLDNQRSIDPLLRAEIDLGLSIGDEFKLVQCDPVPVDDLEEIVGASNLVGLHELFQHLSGRRTGRVLSGGEGNIELPLQLLTPGLS